MTIKIINYLFIFKILLPAFLAMVLPFFINYLRDKNMIHVVRWHNLNLLLETVLEEIPSRVLIFLLAVNSLAVVAFLRVFEVEPEIEIIYSVKMILGELLKSLLVLIILAIRDFTSKFDNQVPLVPVSSKLGIYAIIFSLALMIEVFVPTFDKSWAVPNLPDKFDLFVFFCSVLFFKSK